MSPRLASLAIACFLCAATLFGSQTAPYAVLDNIEDDWVNLHPVPTRPMTITDDSQDAYVLNAQLDTIVHFNAALETVDVFRTLRGPVSIAQYQPPGGEPELLVVCTLSDALVRHRLADGEVLEVIDLPAEPVDLLVDQANHRAWVSSGATDQVLEFDLLDTGAGPDRTFAIPARNPWFLSMTDAGEVLVAPRWSGNNSVVSRNPIDVPNDQFDILAGVRGILDLADPTVAVPPGLPDEDLFWLDPASETAVPVAREVGTILLAHEQNPATGQFWQLNTEANNKDPNAQGEPAIRGFISTNRISLFDLPSPLGSRVVDSSNQRHLDLDLAHPGQGYDRARSVGTPYSLDFSTDGYALVAGLLTDNLTLLDSSAEWLTEWDLPEGCVPRQVLLDPSEQFITVYCSGTNTIPIYFYEHIFLDGGPPVIGTIDIGFDPTPEPIRAGRRIFFDASHSLNNNHSCATCHDEGRLDMVAWDLSSEIDDKGPMVTQSLSGINRLVPFHWRGEQQGHLADFNAAFDLLLGGDPLPAGPGSEFDLFERWVLSLENPANPFASPDRLIDDAIQPPVLSPRQVDNASAAKAQNVFFADATGSCVGCHGAPAGTSNSMVGDGVIFQDPRPRRQWFKTAGFLHLWMRGLQPDVTVSLFDAQGGGPAAQTYPRGGVGLAHSGNPRNIFHFADFFTGDDKLDSNMASFMFQFDSGLGRAVHASVLLRSGAVEEAISEISGYLLFQADSRNCDVGVFGRDPSDGSGRVRGWMYDRQAGAFVRDDGLRQGLNDFESAAQDAEAWFVFAGLPVGSARGWAIDADRDGLLDGLEGFAVDGSDGRYLVDTDRDGDWDGHEFDNGGDPRDPSVQSNDVTSPTVIGGAPDFQWSTTRVARTTFEVDELSQATLTLRRNGGPDNVVVVASEYKRQHNLIVDRLEPGSTYTGELEVLDLAGNPRTYAVSVDTKPFVDAFSVVVVGDLEWRDVVPPPGGGEGTMDLLASVRVDRKITLPPREPVQDKVVIARAFINGKPVGRDQLTTDRDDFCMIWAEPVEGREEPDVVWQPYSFFEPDGAPPGPFIVSEPTDASGWTELSLQLSHVEPGDAVDLVIEAITDTTELDCDLTQGPILISWANSFSRVPIDWSFPDTPEEFRSIRSVVP